MMTFLSSVEQQSDFSNIDARHQKIISRSASVLAFFMMSTSLGMATDYTWTGTANVDALNPGNYTPVLPTTPQDGDSLLFFWDNGTIANLPEITSDSDLRFNLRIGTQGKFGSFDISNGAQVTTSWPHSTIDIADMAGSTGIMNVKGTSTKLTSNWAPLNTISVGMAGNGTLNVLDGGSVNASQLVVGRDQSATGRIVVDGQDSQLAIINSAVFGEQGSALLEIKNGGQLSIEDTMLQDLIFASQAGSSAAVTIDGAGSVFKANYFETILGQNGEATVNVVNGGSFLTGAHLILGSTVSGEGVLVIDGIGSLVTWGRESLTSIYVGAKGIGNLTIKNGGAVQEAYLHVGANGTVTIGGDGSKWSDSEELYAETNGTLIVRDGGLLTSGRMVIANNAGDSGNIIIDGEHSQWNVKYTVELGRNGAGQVAVTNGGLVSSADVFVGASQGSNGTLIVRDAGSGWFIIPSTGQIEKGGSLHVGLHGDGTATISDGAFLHVTDTIFIASDAGVTGTLNIGSAPDEIATAAGEVTAQNIVFGNGTGAVNFNHINDNYVLAAPISGAGLINQLQGSTILTGDSMAFTGSSFVHAGTLIVNGALGGSMAVVGGRLQGTGVVGSTINEADGIIAPGSGGFDILTINGDYIGKGGTIEIVTILGGDNSQTSRFSITGDTSGSTNLKVINHGGLGAQTSNGIKVIEVGGQSSGAFTLQGDYVTKDGQQAVVAGAYAYSLHQNGVNTQDGDWYLRSELKDGSGPVINPGAPVYEGYAMTLQALNKLPTLQQRVGNRFWNGAVNSVAGQGADAHGTPLVSSSEADALVDQRGIWGRVEGGHNRLEANRSATGMTQDVNTVLMQAGIDGMLTETETGQLLGGFTAQYGKARGDIASNHGDGKIDTQGWGLGATLTWYGENGLYLDMQTQAMWYDSDLNSGTAKQSLINGNKGFGYALSFETGKRIGLDASWSVTPQAQLVWSSVDFDTFNDAWGASVSNRSGDSLNARLGISADYRNAWRDTNGIIRRSNIYGIINLYQEFMGAARVDVAGVDFANDNDRTWGGMGAGGTYSWNDDAYALYGEGSLNTSLNNFADSYTIKGTIGFKMKW